MIGPLTDGCGRAEFLAGVLQGTYDGVGVCRPVGGLKHQEWRVTINLLGVTDGDGGADEGDFDAVGVGAGAAFGGFLPAWSLRGLARVH